MSRVFSRTDEAGGVVWRVRFLLLWLFFPVFLTVLLSLARPVFLARYFIFCLPALLLLAADGLARLSKQWQLALAVAVMMLISLKGTLAYGDHDFDVDRDGIGAASNYVLDHAQPGDAILFHIAGTRVGYEFYRSLRGDAGPEIIFPRHGERLEYRDFTGKPTPDFLKSIPRQYGRVWVVLMNNVSISKDGEPHPDPTTLVLSDIMAGSFPGIQQWEFPDVEVQLYSRR
jgi:hypothetical protein